MLIFSLFISFCFSRQIGSDDNSKQPNDVVSDENNNGICGARSKACRWEYNKKAKQMIFNGNGQMTIYSEENPAPWNGLKEEIEEIVIEEGIKSIGSYAFYNLPKLKTLILPQSLKAINDNAITNCSSLEYVYHYSKKRPGRIGKGFRIRLVLWRKPFQIPYSNEQKRRQDGSIFKALRYVQL